MKTHSFSVVGDVVEFVTQSWWTAPANLVTRAGDVRLRHAAAKPFSSARWWLLLLVSGALLTGRGQAATISWTNTAGGLWSTAANWSPNQVPGAADTVRITNSGTYLVTLDVNATVAGFTLGASSGSSTQTFAVNGPTFTLNGTGTVTTKGQFNFGGGTLDGVGTNTVSGVFNWSAGTLDGRTTPGLLAIAAGGRLNITTGNDHDLPGWRLNNAGTVAWAGGSIRGSGGSVLNNSGLWDAQADGAMLAAFTVGMVFNNSGTFRKSGGAGITTIQNDVVFNHTGLVEAQTGQLAMNAGGTSTGGYNASGGTLIEFSGARSFSVTNSFTGAGTNRLTTGAYAINGTVLSDNLELVGSTFTGTNTFIGTVNWINGVFNGPGQTTLPASAAHVFLPARSA